MAAIVLRELLRAPEACDAVLAQPSDPLAALIAALPLPPTGAPGGPQPPAPPPAQVYGPAWAALASFTSLSGTPEGAARCRAALESRCGGGGGGARLLEALGPRLVFSLQPDEGVDAWTGMTAFIYAAVGLYPGDEAAARPEVVGGLSRLLALAPAARGACRLGCTCGEEESALFAQYAVQARRNALGALLTLVVRSVAFVHVRARATGHCGGRLGDLRDDSG
jgi:hypothetical protein